MIDIWSCSNVRCSFEYEPTLCVSWWRCIVPVNTVTIRSRNAGTLTIAYPANMPILGGHTFYVGSWAWAAHVNSILGGHTFYVGSWAWAAHVKLLFNPCGLNANIDI